MLFRSIGAKYNISPVIARLIRNRDIIEDEEINLYLNGTIADLYDGMLMKGGMNEHPTQALLDMLTMQQAFGRLEGLKVAIIGDVQHSRVARSNFWGLTTMGAEVKMAAPETLIPKDMQVLGVDICSNVESAIRDADVVMGLRMQRERQEAGLVPSYREYSRYFGIDRERMKLAKPNAIVLHPGPLNRGVEMTSEVADGPQSYIREQVTNGVAVRMALLYLLTREGEEK